VVSAFAWQFTFSINNGYINSWFDWLPFISPDTNWFGDHWHAMTASRSTTQILQGLSMLRNTRP
jgi:ABC-type sugar transport system permease subunit